MYRRMETILIRLFVIAMLSYAAYQVHRTLVGVTHLEQRLMSESGYADSMR